VLLHEVEAAEGVVEDVARRTATDQLHRVATGARTDFEDAAAGQRSLGEGLVDQATLVRVDLVQGAAVGPEPLPVLGVVSRTGS